VRLVCVAKRGGDIRLGHRAVAQSLGRLLQSPTLDQPLGCEPEPTSNQALLALGQDLEQQLGSGRSSSM